MACGSVQLAAVSFFHCTAVKKQQYWKESLFFQVDTDAELADLLPAAMCFAAV
jgi:hypothetical protein